MNNTIVSQIPQSINIEGIPVEFKSRPWWMPWMPMPKDNGKIGKPPVHLDETGEWKLAKGWQLQQMSFDDTVKCYPQNGGIGIVFSESMPYTAIDIDSDVCFDELGELTPEAKEIVQKFNTRVELSPSGRGLHLFLRGKSKFEGHNVYFHGKKLEVFSHKGFVTVTGNVYQDYSEIRECQEELNWLGTQICKKEEGKDCKDGKALSAATTEYHTDTPASVEDAAIISRIRNGWAAGLFRGTKTTSDDSAADFSLCCALAFFTGSNAAQMDRIFRQSGLYRQKWERADYREMTIRKAITEVAARQGSEQHETTETEEMNKTADERDWDAWELRHPQFREEQAREWLASDAEMRRQEEENEECLDELKRLGYDYDDGNQRDEIDDKDEIEDKIEDGLGLNLGSWTEDSELEEVKWLVPGMVPAGALTVLTAAGGTGKTWLALQLSLAVASGNPFLGMPLEGQGEAVYLYAEGFRADITSRCKQITNSLNLHIPEGNFIPYAEDCVVLIKNPQFLDYIKEHHTKLIVVDSLIDLIDDVNGQKESMLIIRQLQEFVRLGVAVLALHHPKKGAVGNNVNDSLGSTSIASAARFFLTLTTADGKMDTVKHFVLRPGKCNYKIPEGTPSEWNLMLADDGPNCTSIKVDSKKTVSESAADESAETETETPAPKSAKAAKKNKKEKVELSDRERTVYEAIKGGCKTQGQVIKKLCCGKHTASAAIERLEELKLIQVTWKGTGYPKELSVR